MEGELDKVAEGNLEWRSILSTFYKPFEKELKKAEKDVNKQDYVKIADSDKDCPICKKKMILRIGRFGEYLSCQDYPECKGILSVSKNGETSIEIANKSTSDEFVNNYKSAPKTEEGKDYTLKFGRYGYYWAHPEYPKVKDARPLELLDNIFAQIYGKKPLSSDGKVMILKRGRFGEFWAHPDYPAKKEIINIKKSEIEKKKKELGLS
jgi:DNA topoisomerase-1